MGAFCFGWAHMRFSGLVMVALQDLYKTSLRRIYWIFVFHALMNSISPVLAAEFCRRWGSRPVLIFCGICGCIGFSATAFTHLDIEGAITFGFFSGISTGAISTAALSDVYKYFNKCKGTANGVAISGPLLGQFLLTPVWFLLINYYSARGAFFIYGGIYLHVVICGALIRPVEFYTRQSTFTSEKKDEKYPLLPRDNLSNRTKREPQADDSSVFDLEVGKSKVCASHDLTLSHDADNENADTSEEETLLRDPMFISFLLACIVTLIGFQGVSLCLPVHLFNIGMDDMHILYIIVAMGISCYAGRILVNILMDVSAIKGRVPVTVMCTVCTIISGLFTLIMPLFDYFAWYVICNIISGFLGGQIVSLLVPILLEIVGPKRLLKALGFSQVCEGLASIFIPTIVVWIGEAAGGSYAYSLATIGGFSILGGFILLLVSVMHHHKQYINC